MIIFKWNPLICGGGGDGGGDGGGGSGGDFGGEGIGGSTGAEGPGFGGPGVSGGAPGIGGGPGIGPGSAGGNPGLAGASGGQNAGMGAEFGGFGGLEGALSSEGISIAPVSSQVAQSQAESTGNLGFLTIAKNQFNHIQSKTPKALSIALSAMGVPVTEGMALASLGHALGVVTGADMSGSSSTGGVAGADMSGSSSTGNQAGPGWDVEYWTDAIKRGQAYSAQTGVGVSQITGGSTMPMIPSSLQSGYNLFVKDSDKITDQYQDTADELWNDYLDFEKTFFGKYEDNQSQYQENLAGMPKVNLTMPETMGGSTIPLAPKVHSAMYTDQFNAMNSGIGNQANASLAGLGSRDALSKNMFQTNLQNLQNSFLPTQAGMDLYQMERAGQLGINSINAQADANKPSTLSTWAPVVGSVLQADWGDSSVGEGLWDWGSDFLGGLF